MVAEEVSTYRALDKGVRIAFVAIALLSLAIGCRRSESSCAAASSLRGVRLETSKGTPIDPELVGRLAAARAHSCEVSEKPDAILLDGAGNVRVSVFAADRFFVLGNHLDAWIAGMEDKPYCCYSIGSVDVRVLTSR